MKATIDYTYGEPIVAVIQNKDSSLFLMSELDIKVPERPYFCLGGDGNKTDISCTKNKFNKWQNSVEDRIAQAIYKSLKPELYGEVKIEIKGLEEVE